MAVRVKAVTTVTEESTMTATATPGLTRPACTDHPQVFQHEYLETPPTRRDGPGAQAEARLLAARAAAMCASCPLFETCLYDAVVKHDVSGFAAGTTESQRLQIRQRLRVTIDRDDLDALAGLRRSNRQLDSGEVRRLRAANPHESLEVLAMRLGCSLSTIKRHMRRAREEAPRPVRAVSRPTPAQVLRVAADIARGRRSESRVA